jgi:transcriptional regulator with XRE-family HTH domain
LNASARKQALSELARILRTEREKRGLSKTDVATKAGISSMMVGLVESGARNPTVDTLLRLASALEIDPAELLRRSLSPRRISK